MYRQINVWRRIDPGTAACYRCFESILDGSYCVQSVDYFRLPLDDAQQKHLRAQLVELFVEQDPLERSGGFPTLAEAIAAHDRDFDDDAMAVDHSPSKPGPPQ